VNGALFPGQRSFDFLAQVSDPTRPGAEADLATAGVRWAVVNPWGYASLGREAPFAVTSPPPGFAVLETFPDGSAIWLVTAKPREGLLVFRPPGFGWGIAAGSTTWHPVQEPAGNVTLWARAEGRYRITLTLRGLDPGEVSARADGSPIAVRRTARGVWFESPAGRDPREIELTFGQRGADAAVALDGMRRIG